MIEDQEWIKEGDKTNDFEGEVFLSTDGKHTVHVKANNPLQRRYALVWAKECYEAILKAYGTKQGQAVKEYANTNSNPSMGTTVSQPQDLGNCPKCGAANNWSIKKSKTYCSAFCWKK